MRSMAYWVISLILVTGVIGMAHMPVWAGCDENEREITINEVPQPVREIIIKEAGNNKITEIEVVHHGDWWIYEAEWISSGKEVEISIALTCKLISKEVEEADEEDEEGDDDDDGDEEEEIEVSWRQVPAPVKKTFRKLAGDNEIVEMEMFIKGSRKYYTAEWIVGDKEIEILVAANGKFIGKEVEEADEEDEEGDDDDDDDEEEEIEVSWRQVPAPVKKAFRKLAGDNEIVEMEMFIKGNRKYYTAEWIVGDKEIEVVVAANGKFISKEVEEADDDEDDELEE